MGSYWHCLWGTGDDAGLSWAMGVGRGGAWDSEDQEWPFFMGSPQDLPPSNSSPLPGVSNTVLTLFLAVCGGQHGYVMSRQPHEAELQGCGQRTSSLAFPKVGCLVLVCTWLWSRKQSRGKHIDLSTFSCKEQKAQLKGRCISCTEAQGTTAQGW